MLANVLDTLALVRLGRIVRTDASGGFTNHLLIATLNRYLKPVVLDCDSQTSRNDIHLGRSKTERKRKLRPLENCLETSSFDRKLLLEALRNPDHHVVDQRAGEAVEGTEGLVVSAGNENVSFFNFSRDAIVHRIRKFAERTLYRDRLTRERHCDAISEFNGFFTNSRHCLSLLIKQRCR